MTVAHWLFATARSGQARIRAPQPDPTDVYDSITADMQQTLDRLSDERTAPVIG